MVSITNNVQVNIPLTMLSEGYMERFISQGLNPEIGLDAEALDRYAIPEIRETADRLLGRGLTITLHGPFMDLSPGSPDSKIREVTRNRFEQVLRLVPLFRPVSVVFHASYDETRYGFDRDSWIRRSLDTWTWLGRRLREGGTRLMLENVYERAPEDILPLFEAVEKDEIQFCLDTGHQAAFSDAPLDAWLDVLGSYLGQVHLHDNHGQGDEHLALGLGIIDFPAFFRQLRAGREAPPVVTLEPHREEDLGPSLEYLDREWPW
jgi:sugar phosphate isomerase/epimerase